MFRERGDYVWELDCGYGAGGREEEVRFAVMEARGHFGGRGLRGGRMGIVTVCGHVAGGDVV